MDIGQRGGKARTRANEAAQRVAGRRNFLAGGAAAALCGGRPLLPRRCVAGTRRREKNAGIEIDADFPGGNIVVERIEGDTVHLHQDQRDTKQWWFYWCFRVRGAAGRALTFRFTRRNVLAARGPAVSTDRGAHWSWLGAEAVRGASFRYAFPAGADTARFCLAVPYLEADLDRFLARHRHSPHLRVETLCTTHRGRTTRRLHVGRLAGEPEHRVVLTCRHHSCEMMASWALEGLLEAALADDETGRWFRDRVEILAVPFMDKDGVEEGDQGKFRQPHDHNRDYLGESIYPSVAALRELLDGWSRGRLHFTMDMHCPWIRGGRNEEVFFVGHPDETIWQRQQHFSRIVADVRTGPLPHDPKHDIAWGKEWNTGRQPRSSTRYMATLPGVRLAISIEIPYASAGGRPVTAASARALGRDLAAAIRRWLRQDEGSGSASDTS